MHVWCRKKRVRTKKDAGKEEGNKGRKEEKELFDFVRESLGWTVDYPWDNVAVAAT